MATSSITRNFVITGKDKVEAFANALEESANAFVSESKVSARQLTDPDEIKALMMKAKEKKGENHVIHILSKVFYLYKSQEMA